MEIVSITTEQFNNLPKVSLSKEVINSESNILKLVYQQKNYIVKELFYDDNIRYNNKLYTLNLLDKYSSYFPKTFVIPTLLLENEEGKFIGFASREIPGVNLASLLEDEKTNASKKIQYLKQIGELLEQLKQIRKQIAIPLYFNDLHEGNFVVNPEDDKLYVVDLDSVKIEKNIPGAAKYITPFSLVQLADKYKSSDSNQIVISENTDYYCYMMIILKYLTERKVSQFQKEQYIQLIDKFKKMNLPKNFIEACTKILSEENNINPYLTLDTLPITKIKNM